MSVNYNYNYAFVFYDIGEKRVQKIFKICKKYFKHHQQSVFRGHITPSNLIKFKKELSAKIDKEKDFITIIKLVNESNFEEETIGVDLKQTESLFI